MPLPCVYADFNGIEDYSYGQFTSAIDLTGYGTIASLSNQKLRLIEGMALLLYEPNDIEVEGIAHFDLEKTDPAGRNGAWVALIDPEKIRDSSINVPTLHQHRCFGCGHSLLSHLKTVGHKYEEFCPHCGTSIMAPLSPPEKTT